MTIRPTLATVAALHRHRKGLTTPLAPAIVATLGPEAMREDIHRRREALVARLLVVNAEMPNARDARKAALRAEKVSLEAQVTAVNEERRRAYSDTPDLAVPVRHVRALLDVLENYEHAGVRLTVEETTAMDEAATWLGSVGAGER